MYVEMYVKKVLNHDEMACFYCHKYRVWYSIVLCNISINAATFRMTGTWTMDEGLLQTSKQHKHNHKHTQP